MTDRDTTDFQEGKMDVIAALIPNAQSAELMQPTDGPFDHPAEKAQPAAVFVVAVGNVWFYSPLRQLVPMEVGIISPIREQGLRTLHRSTHLSRDRWNRIHQRDQLRYVMVIGTREAHGQRKAFRIRDKVMFRAFFPAIHRAGAGFFAPPTARTWELSTTA